MLFLKPTLPLAFEHGYNILLSYQFLIPKERRNVRQHEQNRLSMLSVQHFKVHTPAIQDSLVKNLKFLLIRFKRLLILSSTIYYDIK